MYPVSRLPRRHNTHRISKRKAPCLLRPRGLDHFHVFGRWSRRLLLRLRRLRRNGLERRYLRWRKAPHHHHRLSEVRNDPERSDSDRRAQVVVPMLSSRDTGYISAFSCTKKAKKRLKKSFTPGSFFGTEKRLTSWDNSFCTPLTGAFWAKNI